MFAKSDSMWNDEEDDHQDATTIRKPSLIAITFVWTTESTVISLLKWGMMIPEWSRKIPPIPLLFKVAKNNLPTLNLIERTEGETQVVLILVGWERNGTSMSSALWQMFDTKGTTFSHVVLDHHIKWYWRNSKTFAKLNSY